MKNRINSFDTREIYRELEKKKRLSRSLAEKDFSLIVKTLNESLADELLEYGYVQLPKDIGTIVVITYPKKVKKMRGKLRTNSFPNWKATKELWASDEEAKEKKYLIFHNDPRLFMVKYKEDGNEFNNSKYLLFKVIRPLREKIRARVKSNKLIGFSE